MKYKSEEEIKDDVNNLGISALSKFSAINHLSKLGIPLSGMLDIERMVREVECGLWSLITLGLGDDQVTFDEHIKYMTKKFHIIIETSKTMKSAMKEL